MRDRYGLYFRDSALAEEGQRTARLKASGEGWGLHWMKAAYRRFLNTITGGPNSGWELR